MLWTNRAYLHGHRPTLECQLGSFILLSRNLSGLLMDSIVTILSISKHCKIVSIFMVFFDSHFNPSLNSVTFSRLSIKLRIFPTHLFPSNPCIMTLDILTLGLLILFILIHLSFIILILSLFGTLLVMILLTRLPLTLFKSTGVAY